VSELENAKQCFMASCDVEDMPADKQRLANAAWDECAKVYEKENADLRKQIEELQARVERLRKLIMDKTYLIRCESLDFTWPDDVVAVLSEPPAKSLDRLKYEWQAEAALLSLVMC